MLKLEVRDSQTGYLLPVRDAQGTLPDVESCWDAVAVAVAVAGAAAPRRPPKYKFRHPKYSGISSDTQGISSDTQSTAVFPGSQVIKMVRVSVFPGYHFNSFCFRACIGLI